jgi:hypothetical protein
MMHILFPPHLLSHECHCTSHSLALLAPLQFSLGVAVPCRYLSQEVGLPCHVAAVNIALWSDNLECQKLLLERPAMDEESSVQFTAWDKFDVDVAARKGFAECIALAVKHGCPWYHEVCGSNP